MENLSVPETRYKVDFNGLRNAPSPYVSLIRKAVKKGGGTVLVLQRQHGKMGIAGSRMDAMLGLVWVPEEALTPVIADRVEQIVKSLLTGS